ncbi:hypothetical protein LDDCCGHA_2578 [Methylobacterium oxalidis]|nr:hypothetical protein LDDCCGHA_2578 [Methylobacterium oxalidis]
MLAILGRLATASAWACLTVDCSELTSLVIESMPFEAAWIVCTPFEIPSRRPERVAERSFRAEAVKKFVGLSSALATFLPVERWFWVTL